MRNTRRTIRGFSLIETIAAIVVMAIAIPPILVSIREAHVQRVNPALSLQARWLAVEKLEDVIADRYSLTRGYDWLVASNYTTESPVSGFAPFTRRVTFTETGPDLTTPGTGYMTVRVEVEWTDATSTLRTIAIDTVVTEYTP